ncbi:hypothetical protein QTN47_24375 [Danxiaibacter flavus]|uniref:SMI1/KNR4 family protein n=1 Tax=Danxiaibacter flavus TaxID=3049108 RepID=A0ABV3ZM88_9BACT|nr:hypothetical protein QNM32_24380 [Chitinophagaceae bacterium DXS]
MSNKTYKYLDALKRDFAWTSGKEEVEKYLLNQDIPAFEKVVQFQTNFSGLILTIVNKPTQTFKAQLFSKKDISTKSPADFIKLNEHYYFGCGEHETAQYNFVIDEKGQIGVYDNNLETVNIIFSSFEKMLETYSLENLLTNWYENPFFFKLVSQEKFQIFTKDFRGLSTKNDDYDAWLRTDELVVHKGTWFDKAAFYIHIYGNEKNKCDDFIKVLKENGVIE